ncbi:uncharacterized protein B0T23DRAFT_395309 [Neurospora hispaniola]|uniref:Uncharacterized protein n=1 Tax=Neurospora hispaniola TaxID=588809 RepID=A0AAJ0IBI4_9PEZI|nr:hypothetical protein B0T23DRAFT_395309 [Neurospora hispaniola]
MAEKAHSTANDGGSNDVAAPTNADSRTFVQAASTQSYTAEGTYYPNAAHYPVNTTTYPVNTSNHPVNTTNPHVNTSNQPVNTTYNPVRTIYPNRANHTVGSNGPNGPGSIIPLNSTNIVNNNQPPGNLYPTRNPPVASVPNVAQHFLPGGQGMNSHHHLAGTPNLAPSHNPVPNYPRPPALDVAPHFSRGQGMNSDHHLAGTTSLAPSHNPVPNYPHPPALDVAPHFSGDRGLNSHHHLTGNTNLSHNPVPNHAHLPARDVAPNNFSGGQAMASPYHPSTQHLAGNPYPNFEQNPIPNPPHPPAPSAQATTHVPAVARPPVIRPAVPSGQTRVCKGSRRQGIHYPCVKNPPNRVWKTKGHARKCRDCLANKPSERACRLIDALEAAGLEPCSNCYVKAARGDGDGGLCPDCLADKQANAKLRKEGKGKGRKKGNGDDVPRGGPGGGPPKGDGGGGGGSGPAPGAVGVVLSGIDQMAY